MGEQRWHTIVGVVADVRGCDMTRSVPGWMAGAIYVPHGPYATMEDGKIPVNLSLAVRTAMEPERVGQLVRGIARDKFGSGIKVADQSRQAGGEHGLRHGVLPNPGP